MVVAHRYWQLITINRLGQKKIEVVQPAKQFWLSNIELCSNISDWQVQKKLLDLHKSSCNSNLAKLCLRCYVYYVIDQVCLELEQKFGSKHGFDHHQLLSILLGEPVRLDNFDQQELNSEPFLEYPTIVDKILQTVDLDKANLSTWAKILVRQDRRLNRFLLEQGVYLVSDWGILNDAKPNSVNNVLMEFFLLTQWESQRYTELLQSYHQVYRRDRLSRRETLPRGRCPVPTNQQLQEIASLMTDRGWMIEAVEARFELRKLADYLRRYHILRHGGRTDDLKSLEGLTLKGAAKVRQRLSTEYQSTEPEVEAFLQEYWQKLKQELDVAIASVIGSRYKYISRKDRVKAQQFIQGLKLLYCQGLSMNAIADKLGLNGQYQVSRLLKLKNFRADVRCRLIESLGNQIIAQAKIYAEPQQLQQLAGRVETAFNAHVEEIIEETAIKAGSSKQKLTQTWFARLLCEYLDCQGW